MKKLLSMAMATMLAFGLTACAQSTPAATTEAAKTTEAVTEALTEAATTQEATEAAQTEAQTEAKSPEAGAEGAIRVGAMSGPTAMGMVKLMSDAEAGTTANTYEFAELATEASAFVPAMAQGTLDIACVPSNLAANLYAKTNGGVQVLAVNTECVLYLVSRDESVTEWADLKDKTIYMTGEGAVPEYIVRYLLKANELDAEKDLTIQWCADTTEALSYITQSEDATAILPQPFVTAAGAKVEDLKVVLDLNEEWNKLDLGYGVVTGVVVARTEFVGSHPDEVKAFLEEYKASVSYLSEDLEGAAALIEKYGIVAKAAIAKKALPNCHIVYHEGEEMKTYVEGFLGVLFEQNPKAVGGAMPGEDFYYIGE